MNIVSHNTMSYVKPIHWYDRLFITWSKCQSKTLEEQYESGIRWFDIRVSKSDNWNIVHNRVKYGGIDLLLKILIYLNSRKELCHIRLVYDDRKSKPENLSNICTKDFKILIIKIKREFPNIDIYEATTYWNWKHIISNTKYIDIERHASVCSSLLEYVFCGTKSFALNNNAKNIEKYKCNENCLLYLDFV